MSDEEQCDHKFMFLREEKESDEARYPTWSYYDVFFCERCLSYRRVLNHRSQSDYLGRTVTDRRGELVR